MNWLEFSRASLPTVPRRGTPDLLAQTRLSLAQIESKKTDPNPS